MTFVFVGVRGGSGTARRFIIITRTGESLVVDAAAALEIRQLGQLRHILAVTHLFSSASLLCAWFSAAPRPKRGGRGGAASGTVARGGR